MVVLSDHYGAMVAAIPTPKDVNRLYIPGGLSPEDLHLTLCYLGDAENYTFEDRVKLISCLENHMAMVSPFTAEAFAVAMFNPNNADVSTAQVLGVSGENLATLKSHVDRAIDEFDTENIPEQHKPWVPHITLAYSDDYSNIQNLADRLGPVSFSNVRVAFGSDIIDIPLGEEGTMGYQASYLVDALGLELSEDGDKTHSWIQALPIGSYKHPLYGTIEITLDRVRRFADNVVKRVRGIDPSINYNHTNEGPNAVAAGWVKGAEARTDGLWLFVEWVNDAAAAIRDKKWRYFSAEFTDEWENPEGTSFTDVILGGGLTNRPYMKNLAPINLSESTYENAFELVSLATGKSVTELRGGEESMELNETDLNRIIEGVVAKLGDTLPGGDASKEAGTVKLSEIEELKQLAEENPIVKTLVTTLENQGLSLVENQQKLRENQVARALAEFDKSELVLTPVARNLVHELLLNMPDELSGKFWQLMEHMRKSQSFLVDISERAGVPVRYGIDRSPSKVFNELVNKELAGGVGYADAVERVAGQNPDLYEEYRQESFSFRTSS